MKNNLTKEQALKALLLVALAGNQAMSIAGVSADDTLKTVDLASASEAVGSATSVNSVSQAPLSVSPNALTLHNATRLKVDRVPITNGSATKPLATAKKYTGKIRICDIPLQVLFEEITENHQKKTRITVTELDAKDGRFTTSFTEIGTVAELGITPEAPNERAKKEVSTIVAQNARRELQAANRCGGPEEAVAIGDSEEGESEPAPRPSRPARRPRGAGKSSELIRKSISRIATLGDITDENEARGRAKNERELERLIKNDLYPSLKAMLMGKDARAEEGLNLLDDAIEELETLGTDGSVDHRRITRLAGTLKGLKYGAETYRRVQEFSEEARALKDDFQNARGQGGQILPEQYQQYQELQSRMQQEIVMGPYAQLSQYRSYMSSTDLNYFMQPYQNLQREMQTIVGGPGAGPNGLNGQIANVPGGIGGMPGMNGQIANVPGVGGMGGIGGGGLGPAIPLNQLGGLNGGQFGNQFGGQFGSQFSGPFNGQFNGMNTGLIANSPFNNPAMLNRGGSLGPPVPLSAIGGLGGGLGLTQPVLSQPPFSQSGIVANVPSPVLGSPFGGGAPMPTLGSPIVPAPVTPFSAPVPTINRAPLVATNSFGYGSPSPFVMTQPSLFSSTVAQPQFYANQLPAQSVVSPAAGVGSLGAYANFSLNFGAPSVFSTPVGPYYR